MRAGVVTLVAGRLASMAPHDDLDDSELARRAAEACVESFSALARRHQVRVVHYVRQMLGPAASGDADDVAQEAFVRAWQAIATFDRHWAFSTWLFTIARRVCLNHVRARRRRRVRETVSVALVFEAGDPSESTVDIESGSRLWEIAAEKLPERQFSAIWLRYAEAKSFADIAAVLETTEANVKLILFRARRQLAPFVHDLVE